MNGTAEQSKARSRPGPGAAGRVTAPVVVLVLALIVAGLVHKVTSPASAGGIVLPEAHDWVATLTGDAVADGALPGGASVSDDRLPGVGNLDPDLRRALQEAEAALADDGLDLHVTSGWRSPAYQEHLLREAVSDHGPEDAARWVATPTSSRHVSGDAVDLGGSDATAWLSRHGSRLGLCQIYRNEPWHYELRPGARDQGCPPMYADPTDDPRMRP